MSALYAGLDVGTTGAKALLVDERGTLLASATEEYPTHTPRPLWSEQDPEDWWTAAVRAFGRLFHECGRKPEEVKGVGLTGQMHGLVLLDRRGGVLRPCIMWNDQRTAPQCEELTSKLGFDRLLELTGNPALPGFTAPKILWVRQNEPHVFERTAHILLPKDYIRYRLTGEFATEVSDAAGTLLLDVRRRSWSPEMLRTLEIRGEWLPGMHESPDVSARVSTHAARETGFIGGTPVVGGGGDQAAGAVGSGVVREGVVSVTVGTSGVVFAHSDAYRIEPRGRLHAFCHAVPGAWHLMGVTLAAGGSLRWYRDTLGESDSARAKERGMDPYEVLTEGAGKVPPGSEGLLFLPYLSGERTPYPDPNARGAFVGLTIRHTRAHMTRAVLEGVAFSLRDCLELMKNLKLDIREVRVSGGGARSTVWRQIMADVFNVELVTVTSTEGAPFGAALLAAVGAGHFKTVYEACDAMVKRVAVMPPQRKSVPVYEQLYQSYRELYPSLKGVFSRLTQTALM